MGGVVKDYFGGESNWSPPTQLSVYMNITLLFPSLRWLYYSVFITMLLLFREVVAQGDKTCKQLSCSFQDLLQMRLKEYSSTQLWIDIASEGAQGSSHLLLCPPVPRYYMVILGQSQSNPHWVEDLSQIRASTLNSAPKTVINEPCHLSSETLLKLCQGGCLPHGGNQWALLHLSNRIKNAHFVVILRESLIQPESEWW